MYSSDVIKIDSSRPVVLIGAGQLGKMAIALWPQALDKPLFFLDENTNATINGIPVYKTTNHKPDPSIQYVLSFFKSDPKVIKELFNNFLQQEIITIYDLLTQSNSDLFSNGWSGNSTNLLQAVNNIEYFSDYSSKSIYRSVLNWRYHRVLDDSIPSPEQDKYNLKKFGGKHSYYDLVIDGGSYDFSFPLSLLDLQISWGELTAIEPDSVSQLEVNRQIDMIQKKYRNLGECRFEKRALWRTNQGAYFYQNGLLSARIARGLDKTCKLTETVTLEEILSDKIKGKKDKVLTKLHVEGAEWPIIESSTNLLKQDYLHDMLINLSHDEESLIKIPKALYETGKFDLFLHSHSLFGEGLTLFARRKMG